MWIKKVDEGWIIGKIIKTGLSMHKEMMGSIFFILAPTYERACVWGICHGYILV